MARAFGQRPSTWLDGADEWIARDYDEACFEFGEAFDGMREATKETIPPKTRKNTVQVPKHTREELLSVLGYEIEHAPPDVMTDTEADDLYERMMAELPDDHQPHA